MQLNLWSQDMYISWQEHGTVSFLYHMVCHPLESLQLQCLPEHLTLNNYGMINTDAAFTSKHCITLWKAMFIFSGFSSPTLLKFIATHGTINV